MNENYDKRAAALLKGASCYNCNYMQQIFNEHYPYCKNKKRIQEAFDDKEGIAYINLPNCKYCSDYE